MMYLILSGLLLISFVMANYNLLGFLPWGVITYNISVFFPLKYGKYVTTSFSIFFFTLIMNIYIMM